MTYPHRPNHRLSPRPIAPETARPWTVNRQSRPQRSFGLTRRYEMNWLDSEGAIHDTTRVAPAMPAFEMAFSAFARGALIATPEGPVAIEDLVPGTTVSTRSGPERVRWIGRILLPPANLRQDSGPDIYRLTVDCLGPQRPNQDLVLGSAARMVRRVVRASEPHGAPEALVPIGDFVDGASVMQLTPMSAVHSYHLALDRHAILDVNGLPVESYHPGGELGEVLTGELLRLFLSFFPWVTSLGGFGPAVMPRMAMDEIDAKGSV